MTTATDDSRLGMLEGRIAEQSVMLQQLGDRLDTGLREVRQEIRQEIRNVNSRIDRMFLAVLGVGAAQIALLITLIFRTT